MLKIIISVTAFISLCLLIVLLNITTPATAGPFGILAIFVFVYILSLGVITCFIYLVSRIVAHLSFVFMTRRPLQVLSLRQSYYYSTVIAAAPILLIALQSVGPLSLYEFILIIIFVTIGCLFISKRVR